MLSEQNSLFLTWYSYITYAFSKPVLKFSSHVTQVSFTRKIRLQLCIPHLVCVCILNNSFVASFSPTFTSIIAPNDVFLLNRTDIVEQHRTAFSYLYKSPYIRTRHNTFKRPLSANKLV